MKRFTSILVVAFVITASSYGKSIAPPNAAWTMRSLAEVLNTKTHQGKLVAKTFNDIGDTNVTAVEYTGTDLIKAKDNSSIRRDKYLITGTISAILLVRVSKLSEPKEPWNQSSTLKVTYEVTLFKGGKTKVVDPETGKVSDLDSNKKD